jgi:hypothetical protein
MFCGIDDLSLNILVLTMEGTYPVFMLPAYKIYHYEFKKILFIPTLLPVKGFQEKNTYGFYMFYFF